MGSISALSSASLADTLDSYMPIHTVSLNLRPLHLYTNYEPCSSLTMMGNHSLSGFPESLFTRPSFLSLLLVTQIFASTGLVSIKQCHWTALSLEASLMMCS